MAQFREKPEPIEWFIDVVDAKDKPWPPAAALLKVGVPLAMVRRYQIARRDMTAGLRRRIKQAVN